MTDLYDITNTFTKNQENWWNICKKYVNYNILYFYKCKTFKYYFNKYYTFKIYMNNVWYYLIN